MTSAKNSQLSLQNLLVPVMVMALTMALFFVFQLTQVMRDRTSLSQVMQQLEAPFAESQKLNTQFGGLVVGTRKLADEGNETAKELVARLKQIGVLPDQAQAPAPAPVPAAMVPQTLSPVKP